MELVAIVIVSDLKRLVECLALSMDGLILANTNYGIGKLSFLDCHNMILIFKLLPYSIQRTHLS